MKHEQADTGQVIKQQTIEVGGSKLIVACTIDGLRYLSVNAVCKALKIDRPTQLRRIRGTEIQTHLRKLSLHFLSGGDQLVYCLPVEDIGPWLAGLLPDTVKPEYQVCLLALKNDLPHLVEEAVGKLRPFVVPYQESWDEIESISPRTSLIAVSHQMETEAEEAPLAAQRALHAQLPPPAGRLSIVIPLSVYAEHTAFREASVAKPQRWTQDGDSGQDPYFLSQSTNLQVYVSRPTQPIGLEAAMRRILELSPSTVLTARVAFAIWNARRHLPPFIKSGWVAIDVEEFLLLRHLQMHSRAVSPDSDVRVFDGFERKYVDRLQTDLDLVNGSHIRRWVTRDNYYDSPYLRVSMLMERNKKKSQGKEKDRLVRVAVAPGEWMPSTYPQAFDRFVGIDERMIQLNLKTDINALLIGFYLTERWRQQALQAEMERQAQLSNGFPLSESPDSLAPYREPIRMRDLLEASVIEINEHNLTYNFAPRIERSLQKLFENGILAEPVKFVTPVDKNHNWGEAWLNAFVLLLPKLDTIEDIQTRVRVTEEFYQLSLFNGNAQKQLPPHQRRKGITHP